MSARTMAIVARHLRASSNPQPNPTHVGGGALPLLNLPHHPLPWRCHTTLWTPLEALTDL